MTFFQNDRSGRLAAVLSGTVLLFTTAAAAQDAEPPAAEELPPEPLYEPPASPEPTETTATVEVAPADSQASAETTASVESFEEAEEPAVAAEPRQGEPADVQDEPKGVGILLFADSYYSWNSSAPTLNHFPMHRAYDGYNGFNLSWLGADLTYDGGQIGATASFRLGSGYPIFFGDESLSGVDTRFYPLTQAYLSWSPVEALTIDVGQFGTIFGAEVAESWQNLNYSRGALYYAMQPFWHTGLRANYALSETVEVNAMVVNGTNQAFAVNHAPALAGQAVFTPDDAFSLAVGYMHQVDPDSAVLYPSGGRSGFDNFFDVVAVAELGDLTVVGNFDYNISRAEEGSGASNTSFWGASLALGYAFTEVFGAAIRGEYLKDNDAGLWTRTDPADPDVEEIAEGNHLMTGTLTLEAKPVENLIIRWDNRVEKSDQNIFFDRQSEATDIWFNSILGVVVKSE